MGIFEIEAAFIGIGGCILMAGFYALAKAEPRDMFALIVFLGGCVMLAFALLDVAVDHL